MLARVPLEQAINQVSPIERDRLLQIQPILTFASNEIGLFANGSYQSFVPLDRDYPVYVVTAAPEFSLEPMQWCYLVIGCASYRGYFSEEKAEQYARDLHDKQAMEVWVQGANAYSTLGWFNDPILPSMLRYGEVYLAELLFHELTHQRLYLNGDTDFNEALASAVAEIATLRWLSQKTGASNGAALGNAGTKEYLRALAMREDFDNLIGQHRKSMEALFALREGEGSTAASLGYYRAAKQHLQAQLLLDYQTLKATNWDGDTRYDNWFEQPVNNARLSGLSSYRAKVSEFKALLKECDNELNRFFETLDSLSSASKTLDTLGISVPKKCS
jgi:predicted aminopeptidase